jgi:hypothetical protein
MQARLLLLLLLLLLIYLFTLQVGFSPGGSGTTIKYTIWHKQLMTLQTINDTQTINDNKQLMTYICVCLRFFPSTCIALYR